MYKSLPELIRNETPAFNIVDITIPCDGEEQKEIIDVLKHNRTLTYLSLPIRQNSEVLFKELSLALRDLTSLGCLCLTYDLTDVGMADLSSAIKSLPQLTSLSLNNCKISDTVATTLGAALQGRTNLISLDLGQNKITSLGGEALSAVLKEIPTLTSLKLNNNVIDDQGAKDIILNLQRSSNLKNLSLGSHIGDEGAKQISVWLHQNTTLIQLDLGQNRIGNAGVHALCLSLKYNKTLHDLGLDYNLISEEGVNAALNMSNNNSLFFVSLSQASMSKEQKKRYQNLQNKSYRLHKYFLLAVKNGKQNEAELFLRRGIRVPLTALHVAVQKNHLDLVEYLTEQGGDEVEIYTLHIGKNYDDCHEIVYEYTRRRAQGLSAVDLAVSLGRAEIAHFLKQPRIIERNCLLTSISYRQILDECNRLKASLVMLVLRNCNLNESHIILLAENLQEFSQLRVLNLEDNKIDIYGFNILVKKLPAGLKRLALNNNLIDYRQSPSTFAEFRAITAVLPEGVKIDISANLIESVGHHKGVKKALILILTKYNATVEEILASELKEIRTKNPDEHTLTLKLPEGKEQTIPLDYQQMHNITETKNILRIQTEHAFFVYLFSMQQSKRLMRETLLKQTLFNAKESDEDVQDTAKELMDYYPDAPLKGYIRTHSFFRSNPLPRVNSLLIPRIDVTVDTWVVYILAKKSKPGDILKQHAWLAYEGLTRHGQRFFRVANLTAPMNGYWDQFKNLVVGGAKPAISFFLWDGSVSRTVDYLRENTIMACFTTERSNVKRMHKQVLEDSTNLPLKYKMVLSSSANKDEKNKEMVNCTKWSLDKIEAFLKVSIPDVLKGKYVPYDVVSSMINSGITVNTFDSSNLILK